MDQEETKKIIYSETINLPDLESENKLLSHSMKKLEEEKRIMKGALNRLEEEGAMLRELFNNASSELNNLKKPSLLVAEAVNVFGNKSAVVRLPNGNKFYSYVSKDIKDLKPGDSILIDQKTLNVVDKIDINSNSDVEKFIILDKPKESWSEIGGLKKEIREIKEVIELPLKNPKLFEKVGIHPPKGILLYGPPGTGKTLLAKAVANSTNATFIEVVGSELVQKFIGEGAKLVKEMFSLARSKAPTIVFIDEIDSLAATRMDTGTSGEREVSRTFMQLLAEIDGFEPLDNVKIIGATNRIDILDQAIIRPGRLDRLIEIGLPDEEGRLEILKVHTKRMNLNKVKLKELSTLTADLTGAEIKAVCTEAGFGAIRDNRDYVTREDFLQAIDKIKVEDDGDDEHKSMLG
ncbi:MAG TPA: AAA family ATPase [Candidatus Nanoarchaeia archaeon]|nr:AAA family ATPase [Candidatus Nanoarchaeia archaeon]